MQWTGMINKSLAGLKTFSMNVAALAGLGAGIFTATLPDLSPIETAQYTVVKFGKQLLFSVDVAKDAQYGAEVVLYAGNDFIGTLPIPQVGHRVTSATYNLPPLAINQSNISITAYWKVDHWTSVVWPQELFFRVEVQDASSINTSSSSSG